MSDELARRIKGKRQTCPNPEHGIESMVFDLTEDGGTCLGEGDHEIDRRRPEGYPDSLASELKALYNIDPAGDPT